MNIIKHILLINIVKLYTFLIRDYNVIMLYDIMGYRILYFVILKRRM